ncbi:helix-turn-helix domain-containing protein [Natronolimnohabitans innermongolicus]|uniref:Bacterio-opsin activator HTH domain protein n=1 Tax=Natronolimnohabitans innermongolicus JCM 12255 TaxID=1227499 RepID=L9XHW8_9EURY|nr:helix-turn-helix domain-containing protein [Natronolimnohabitans innermongolicus]ELY61202.1 Bacterio-opsin activator HTH domain protein [Natronolimnohabitans innermongolicus JCM 12255]
MGIITEFRVASLDLPLTDAVAAVTEPTVYIERVLPVDRDRPVTICRTVDDVDYEFRDALADDPTVSDVMVLDEYGESALYRTTIRDPPLPIYQKYMDLGGTPLNGIVTDEGWWLRSRFPDRETLAEFRTFCLDRGATFHLEKLTRESAADEPPFGLTREQHEALVTARDMGYFEVPREASTDEIGSALGISGQSASERLRRGVDRVLKNGL